MSEYFLRTLPSDYVECCPILDDKYRLLFKLGIGRFSKVKMGIEMTSNRRVAIKIMNYRLEGREMDSASEEKLLQIFLNEVHLCLEARHSSIIEIIDFNVSGVCRSHDGKLTRVQYYVMKIAQNGELFQLMSLTEAFNERMARHLFIQLLKALTHLHERRIAHCDIKTENVLIDQHMHLKLADFGYARYHADEMGSPIAYDASEPVGTLKCNAPQTHHGKYHANAVDLFAAGCMLFEMVVKAEPFSSAGPKDQHYHKLAYDKHNFWEIYSARCNPSPEFKDLIQKLLCVNPFERMSIESIMKHSWVTKDVPTNDDYKKEMTSRIKKMMPSIKKNQEIQIKKACGSLKEKGKRESRVENIKIPIAYTRHLEDRIQLLKQTLLINLKEIRSGSSSSKSQDSEESESNSQKAQVTNKVETARE